MNDPFTGEPDRLDVAVTARVEGEEGDGVTLSASLANGTDAEGGDVTVRVSDSAVCAYGLDASVDEFERWVNVALPRKARLSGALAIGELGPFWVVTTPETGPRVIAPTMPTADLAA